MSEKHVVCGEKMAKVVRSKLAVWCYVCMSVHAQKIAKLFFSVRSTQFPFK
jgi:hypothetical protein